VSFGAIAFRPSESTLPLSQAAKQSGTTVKAIQRYAPGALEKRGGRIVVKATDNLERKMLMLTSRGLISVTTHDSQTASIIGAYWHAVRAYTASGDFESLEPSFYDSSTWTKATSSF
jgi:hypothetical protein